MVTCVVAARPPRTCSARWGRCSRNPSLVRILGVILGALPQKLKTPHPPKRTGARCNRPKPKRLSGQCGREESNLHEFYLTGT